MSDPDVIEHLGAQFGEELAGREPSTALIDYLLQHRAVVAAWLDATLAHPAADSSWRDGPERVLRGHLVRALHQRNQFLHVDERTAAEVDALYHRLLGELARALATPGVAVRGVLSNGRKQIAELVRIRLLVERPEVVAGEYSATLQLAVLGLTDQVAGLAEPILDVGCGAGAPLVRALRAAGKDVHGIDRDAPADATVADWMSFDFGEARWGTIVSHLGFSLHFLHLHLAGNDRAFDHARVYMAILRGLRQGGRFAYAPGLPFIESMLPAAGYRVARVPLPPELVAEVQAVQLATGMTLDHATHVHRLG